MPKLTFTKTIPNYLVAQYKNLGWTSTVELAAISTVAKDVITKNSSGVLTLDQRAPSIVQRGSIRRPLGMFSDTPVSDAVKLNHMESVKFSIPHTAFSIIESMWSLYKLRTFSDIVTIRNGREHALQVYGNFDTDAQISSYQSDLLSVFLGHGHTEESLGVSTNNGVIVLENSDFWIDLLNGVVFSFDNQFMQHIDRHLRATFQQRADTLVDLDNDVYGSVEYREDWAVQ